MEIFTREASMIVY